MLFSELRTCRLTPRLASSVAWGAAWAVLAVVQFLVVRACGYDVGPLAAYAGYFVFHVYLPGLVALYFVNRGPVSLTASIALGVPTGFALEIFSFLGLAAIGGTEGWRATPIIWVALAGLIFTRRGEWVLRARVSSRHAGLALGLAVLFLSAVVTSTSHMYAESPLVDGLPQRPIFHDWVYLVSRAAAIKGLWPLEDPSLAGMALQYHYFMLVHVAAASAATGLETTQVLLRMSVLPLGAVLVVQAYALGRALSRSAWGGVLSALLTVTASELGLHPHANESVFLGRFARWLHVSPTFYFGMIFFGALLLAFARWRQMPRPDARHLAWLGLLAAAATGAKGTVVPVTLVALGLWIGWEWTTQRKAPWRLMIAGVGCGVMFLAVYFTTMAGWGTGAARFSPGDVFHVSDFWAQHFAGWRDYLMRGMPAAWAAAGAGLACGSVIVMGTLGVRALALPFLFVWHPRERRWLAAWLGAVLLACGAMGVTLKLDADSELYVFLLIRLPSAVLAAAFIVRVARQIAGPSDAANTSWRRAGAGVFGSAIALVLVVQVAIAVRRQAPGFRDWLVTARFSVANEKIRGLAEALVWVRSNTEPDALLVANAFTPASMKGDHWGALDGTLKGVHYYYSALSERRLLVEGPHYALHADQVRARMELAEEVFSRKRAATADVFGGGPVYLLVDRAVADAPAVQLPESQRVFSNPRVELFRLPGGEEPLTTASVSQ